MYRRQIEEVADIEKSYQWLEKVGLKDSTEALIMATQEQTLCTKAIVAGVYHIRQDSRCRLCIEASETVQHVLAGCKMQAGTAYMGAITKWQEERTATSLSSMDWKSQSQNRRHLQRYRRMAELRSCGTSRSRLISRGWEADQYSV